MSIHFLWSDAWLLTAVFYARRAEGSATLPEIVGYGDALNHAIFNPEELESGLARLVSAGLLVEVREAFEPSGEALTWYREFVASHSPNIRSMNVIAEKLRAERYKPGIDPRNNLSLAGFSRERYESAVSTWHLRASQLFRT
jgi:hypothetical protein